MAKPQSVSATSLAAALMRKPTSAARTRSKSAAVRRLLWVALVFVIISAVIGEWLAYYAQEGGFDGVMYLRGVMRLTGPQNWQKGTKNCPRLGRNRLARWRGLR